jgi:hypothetical protein
MSGSLYKIEGFQPPRYSYGLFLQGSFVKKALAQELPDSLQRELQEGGRCLAEKTFHDIPLSYQPYIFYESSDEKSKCLVTHVKVLGVQRDAHAIDIDPNFDDALLTDNNYIRYIPHNSDGFKQASTSLILWLNWLNVVNKRLQEK